MLIRFSFQEWKFFYYMLANLVFPGFEVKVVTDDKCTIAQSGLIYCDIVEGQGDLPKDGQQVFPLPRLV